MDQATNGHPDGSASDRLKKEAGDLLDVLADRAVAAAGAAVQQAAGRLAGYARHGGPGLLAAVTGASGLPGGGLVRSLLGRGKGERGGGKKKLKLTAIIESVDVGVPLRVAYDQWTEFEQFPTFTKKVDSVKRDQREEQKLHWKAQVFWSHRDWEATITDQRPDERIAWRSTGAKGHVDGIVTFHELGPHLTRILVIMEYHPQGAFEHIGNLWRAQGRRARLELKHFARHVTMNTLLDPSQVEGWRGEIEDSEVLTSHQDAMAGEPAAEDDEEPGDIESRDTEPGGDQAPRAREPAQPAGPRAPQSQQESRDARRAPAPRDRDRVAAQAGGPGK